MAGSSVGSPHARAGGVPPRTLPSVPLRVLGPAAQAGKDAGCPRAANNARVNAGPAEIAAATERLKAGGVVAFPTETVYGLGASAFDARAVEHVFALKGRPAHNPLIVHVADVAMAQRVAAQWPKAAEALAQSFWPGPLSLILPRRPEVPAIVTAGGGTVAVRCPDHPVALALLRAFGGPLVGPSANKSGTVSPTRSEHVRSVWNEVEVLVLEGGECRTGIESTVLLLAGDAPRVLRPGAITSDQIERVLGRRVEVGAPAPGEGATLQSPGLLASHYAPHAPLRLVAPGEVSSLDPRGLVVIDHTGASVAPGARVLRMPGNAEGYARALYATVREADAGTPALIAVVRPEPGAAPSAHERELWRAILDRLERAAAPRSGR